MNYIEKAVNEAMPINAVITREALRTAMQRGACTVDFTKKDGTNRKMFATLNPEYIPVEALPKEGHTATVNENILAVYDLDVHGWRSITIASIKSVTRHTKAAMESMTTPDSVAA